MTVSQDISEKLLKDKEQTLMLDMQMHTWPSFQIIFFKMLNENPPQKAISDKST